MPISAPKIDKRDSDRVLEQIKALVPFYASELNITDEQGPGIAILRICSHLAGTIINRQNSILGKNFIAFLNMLGAKLLPARSARAPVTFFLAEGTEENVLIPQRTQVAAGDIIFETEKSIVATPAKLAKAYSIVPLAGAGTSREGHEIYRAPKTVIEGKVIAPFLAHLTAAAKKGDKTLFLDSVSGVEKGDMLIVGKEEYVEVSEVFDTKVKIKDKLAGSYDASISVEKVTALELFAGRNLQEHSLYLGHEDLFNIKGQATIRIEVDDEQLAHRLEDSSVVQWQYWGERTKGDGEEVKTLDWYPFDEPEIKDVDGKKLLWLPKTGDDEIRERKINGCKSRWIRCLVTPREIDKVNSLEMSTVNVTVKPPVDGNGTAGVSPDMAYHNDVPLDIESLGEDNPLYPFGKIPRLYDTFYIASQEAFSKKGMTITLNFSFFKPSGLPVKAVNGIDDKIAGRLEDAGIPTIGELLKYTPEALLAKGILKQRQERRVVNILEAARKAFYDKTGTFKETAVKGAAAAGQEELVLSWEYWNGNGWVVLENLDDQTERFLAPGSKTIKFTCPRNIEPTQVSGQDSHWIRVRIVSGDYGKEQFIEDNGTWKADPSQINEPVITQLTIDYGGRPGAPYQPVQHCLTHNNLDFKDVTEESKNDSKSFKPFELLDDEHQALYLGFDRKLEKGSVSIFFLLEEQPYNVDNIPDIDWEYYSEDGNWVRLSVLDGTMNMTQSGIIEFVPPADLSKCERFAENLCWIRACDVDDRFKTLIKSYEQHMEQTSEVEPIRMLHPRIISNYIGPIFRRRPYLRDKFFGLLPRGTFALIDKPIAAEREKSSAGNLILPADDRSQTLPESVSDQTEEIVPCQARSKYFHAEWSHLREALEYPASPKIRGIFPNTAWVIQQETVTDELLGSSDGSANQIFTLARAPVVSEEVWVNEFNALSEDERKVIEKRHDLTVKPVGGENEEVTEFWIQWQEREDLLEAKPKDRVYQIDRAFGKLEFGNGTNGMIPPIGTNNLKATYTTGGGKKGNVKASEISDLKTSIAFVDKVTNPDKAGGGSDTEIPEAVLERMPKRIKHRDRAVTAEDYEWIAGEASSDVARVKSIPNFNDSGDPQAGWVTIIVVPHSEEAKPVPSFQLKHKIEQHIKMRCSNVVSQRNHVQVEGPTYVEVGIDATIYVNSIDAAPLVEDKAYVALRAFLHPLTGGNENNGWEFGRMPFLSDFFPILERIEGVDYVDELSMRVKAEDKEEVVTKDRPVEIKLPVYTLIFSGEHGITAKWRQEE